VPARTDGSVEVAFVAVPQPDRRQLGQVPRPSIARSADRLAEHGLPRFGLTSPPP